MTEKGKVKKIVKEMTRNQVGEFSLRENGRSQYIEKCIATEIREEASFCGFSNCDCQDSTLGAPGSADRHGLV